MEWLSSSHATCWWKCLPYRVRNVSFLSRSTYLVLIHANTPQLHSNKWVSSFTLTDGEPISLLLPLPKRNRYARTNHLSNYSGTPPKSSWLSHFTRARTRARTTTVVVLGSVNSSTYSEGKKQHPASNGSSWVRSHGESGFVPDGNFSH